MTRSDKNLNNTARSTVQEYVTVAFAEDQELAKQHKKMLEENGIPAMVKNPDSEGAQGPGYAVLVREEDLDQAHSMISSEAAFEDFFDVFFKESNLSLNPDDENEDF